MTFFFLFVCDLFNKDSNRQFGKQKKLGKKAFCMKIICSCSATAVIMSITVATGETALIKRKDRVTHKHILKALPAQKQRYKQQKSSNTSASVLRLYLIDTRSPVQRTHCCIVH